ncbi:hypothetical protein LWC35_14530 [Pseudonocardia kujensis]|uniref:hypothetical protein n=1 Tax=Pseudonocardia kujensis TaxID=1128675 RepID=UPI001E41DE0A|nr:hypothetical protein [Pseudonocardia kujensis]MCE0764117.1 hypothetical protein [Pseudonocardia kujensis]
MAGAELLVDGSTGLRAHPLLIELRLHSANARARLLGSALSSAVQRAGVGVTRG